MGMAGQGSRPGQGCEGQSAVQRRRVWTRFRRKHFDRHHFKARLSCDGTNASSLTSGYRNWDHGIQCYHQGN